MFIKYYNAFASIFMIPFLITSQFDIYFTILFI